MADFNTDIEILLKKYLENRCSSDDLAQLFKYFRDAGDLTALENAVKDALNADDISGKQLVDADSVFSGIRQRIETPPESGRNKAGIVSIRKKLLRYTSVAAAVVIGVFAGINYFHKQSKEVTPTIVTSTGTKDVEPGGDKATLTLANGERIALDSKANGTLINNPDVKVEKRTDGRLVYTLNNYIAAGSRDVHMLSTPRGGQYQLVLSDGTKVWLNSMSDISFPSVFGSERRVTITGEVYFEVAHNKDKPFFVSAGGKTIRVLGTKFNVSAYPDDARFKATLLQGSISLQYNKLENRLRPGDQASVGRTGVMHIAQVDTAQVTAWKEGYFSFRNATIEEVMRTLARWYDIDVQYAGKPTKRMIKGRIRKKVKLSHVLEMLGYTGVSFRVSGRTVIIES